MQFTALLNYLNEYPDLYLSAFGLTQPEFTVLNIAFTATKQGANDSTKCIAEQDKLLAALLIVRYQLSNKSVKAVILGGAKITGSELTLFITKMRARLTAALLAQPLLGAKISPAHAPIVPYPGQLAEFSNLDELLTKIQHATAPQALITSKPLSFDTFNAWLETYMGKPVTSKKKTGQAAFMQLLACLQYDAQQFNGEEIEQFRFIGSALNFNMHNASFAPSSGYGKSQNRESVSPLLYSRSQVQNPHGLFFKFMTASLVKGRKRVAQCIMPHNAAAYKIISKLYDTDFTQKLARYDKHGFLKSDFQSIKKTMGHFAPSVGYSGLSQNTYAIMVNGLIAGSQKHGFGTFFRKVVSHLSDGKSQYKPFLPLNPVDLQNQYGHNKRMLDFVAGEMKSRAYHSELQKKLNEYKREHAASVMAGLSNLKLNKIAVSYDQNTFTLDVRFYPDAKNIPNNSNYKEGVTNVILSFFTGLFNYHCAKQGLFIHGQRRQSFGFNRTSITDIGSMMMRVSLGYESAGFVSVMLRSLQSLDKILNDHNFLDKNSPTLKAGFVIVEKSRSKDPSKPPSEKTGNQFRKLMRSEDKMLRAIQTAEWLLLKDKVGDESAVFGEYIQALVTEKFAMPNTPPLLPDCASHPEPSSSTDNLIISGLLNNVLKFCVEKAVAATEIIEHEHVASAHVYHFLLSNISRYAVKAHRLLLDHKAYRVSHVHAKALLLIEDMLEIIILLDSLMMMHIETDKDSLDKTWQLANTEKNYLARFLDINPNEIEVFFTDNGQQALMMSYACLAEGIKTNSTFIYKNCYYELPMNLADNLKIPLSQTFFSAKTVFVDIRDMAQFHKDILLPNKLEMVIIDCTHNPCMSDNHLDGIINQLRQRNILVVLVESMLKHAQLGLDKFQAGKIVTIASKNNVLTQTALNELADVTLCAMTPNAASFFQMINEITRDKIDINNNAPVMVLR